MPFLLVLTSSTRNFEYHLFQVQSKFSFSLFLFQWFLFVMLNSFTLVICPLNCSLTFPIPGISGVLSSFSHMSHQNLTNFSISDIWPALSVSLSTFLKNGPLVSFKFTIIHYSPTSLNEFLKFNLFVPKFVSPTLLVLF